MSRKSSYGKSPRQEHAFGLKTKMYDWTIHPKSRHGSDVSGMMKKQAAFSDFLESRWDRDQKFPNFYLRDQAILRVFFPILGQKKRFTSDEITLKMTRFIDFRPVLRTGKKKCRTLQKPVPACTKMTKICVTRSARVGDNRNNCCHCMSIKLNAKSE